MVTLYVSITTLHEDNPTIKVFTGKDFIRAIEKMHEYLDSTADVAHYTIVDVMTH